MSNDKKCPDCDGNGNKRNHSGPGNFVCSACDGAGYLATPGTGTTASAAGTAVKMPRIIAHEYHNTITGHAIADYTNPTHAGYLRAEAGYVDKPLVYLADAEAFASVLAEDARREVAAESDELHRHQAAEIAKLRAQLHDSQRTAGGEPAAFEAWWAGQNYKDNAKPGALEKHWANRGYIAGKIAAQPVAEAAAQADDDTSTKANYWFGILAKCAHMLGVPVDEPIPSGVLRLVHELTAAPTAQPTPPDDERAGTVDTELLSEMLGRISGLFGTAWNFAYCPSSDPARAARSKFYAAVKQLQDVIDAIAALRQPGALPDAEKMAKFILDTQWSHSGNEPCCRGCGVSQERLLNQYSGHDRDCPVVLAAKQAGKEA